MAKKPKTEDINQIAARIVSTATQLAKEHKQKNPAAQALGKLGGLKGGKARAESLSAKQRKAIATKAAKARWSKK